MEWDKNIFYWSPKRQSGALNCEGTYYKWIALAVQKTNYMGGVRLSFSGFSSRNWRCTADFIARDAFFRSCFGHATPTNFCFRSFKNSGDVFTGKSSYFRNYRKYVLLSRPCNP